MMIRILFAVSLILTSAFSAVATPWQISYEGDDFPENSGWTRHHLEGGADRSIEDGVFVLDSSADSMIADWYTMDFPAGLDPDHGEYFYAEWGLRVTGPPGRHDSIVSIYNDYGDVISLYFEYDRVINGDTGDYVLSLPGWLCSYRVVSSDMQHYDLYVEGGYAGTEVFQYSTAHASSIAFGDGVQGGANTTIGEWDYFRAGVVPAPSSLLLVLPGIGLIRRVRRRRDGMSYISRVPPRKQIFAKPKADGPMRLRSGLATVAWPVVVVLATGAVAPANTIYVYNPTQNPQGYQYDVYQPEKRVVIRTQWNRIYYIYATGSGPQGLGDIDEIEVDFDPGYSGKVMIAIKHPSGFDGANDVGRISLGHANPGDVWPSWIVGDLGYVSADKIYSFTVGYDVTGPINATTLDQLDVGDDLGGLISVVNLTNFIYVGDSVGSNGTILIGSASQGNIDIGGSFSGRISSPNRLGTLHIGGNVYYKSPYSINLDPGGADSISIDGDCGGIIKLPGNFGSLPIGGALSGSGEISVNGDLASANLISIGGGGPGLIDISGSLSGRITGDNGLGTVQIAGNVNYKSPNSIYVNSGGVSLITIASDCYGTINIQGNLGSLSVGGYLNSSTIVGANVSGTISAYGGSGHIDVSGSLDGRITSSSSFGTIHIGQNVNYKSPSSVYIGSGNLTYLNIDGNCDGIIDVNGGNLGTLAVYGDLDGTVQVDGGGITGGLSVDGDLSGSVEVDLNGQSGGGISGGISVEGTVSGTVGVDGDISGGITLDDFDWIATIAAGGDISGGIASNTYLDGVIYAGGDITDPITAGLDSWAWIIVGNGIANENGVVLSLTEYFDPGDPEGGTIHRVLATTPVEFDPIDGFGGGTAASDQIGLLTALNFWSYPGEPVAEIVVDNQEALTPDFDLTLDGLDLQMLFAVSDSHLHNLVVDGSLIVPEEEGLHFVVNPQGRSVELGSYDVAALRVRDAIYAQIDVAHIGLLSFADIDQDNLYVPMHEQEAPLDKDPIVDLTSVQFVKADQMIFDHLPPSSPAAPKYFCFGTSQTPRTDGFEACYSLTAEQPQPLHFMHICGANVDPGWQDHFGLTANIDPHQLGPDECDVDLADFGALAADLAGSQPGPPAASRCDLDVDGDVDLDDYDLLAMQMTGPVGGFIPAAPPGGEQMGGGDGGGEPLGGEQDAGVMQETFDSDEQDTSAPAAPPDEPIDWDQIAAETIAFFSQPDSVPESERPMIVGWFREGAQNDPDPDRAAYQCAVADALEQMWSL